VAFSRVGPRLTPALPLSLPQVTNGGVVCMVQKDKQPEWFPEAKVRPDIVASVCSRAARPRSGRCASDAKKP